MLALELEEDLVNTSWLAQLAEQAIYKKSLVWI
jgi:hypothetical protein